MKKLLQMFFLFLFFTMAIPISVGATCVSTGSPACNISGGWQVCPSDVNQCCDNNGAECPPAPPPTATPRTGPPFASPTPVVTCGGLYDVCCPGGSCNSPYTCSTNGSNLCFNSCQSAGGSCSVACNPLNSTSTGLPGCSGVASQCCVPNASTHPQCDAAGGSCATACGPGNSSNPGADDCPPIFGIPEICCVPGTFVSPSPLCGAGNLGVNTAIGCLMAGSPTKLVGQLLGWGTVVGAGIAFLMIIFAGFQMTTASGDPKRVKAAQELMTSAISGLLLIIFSIFLLDLIGIKILGLATLGGFQP